MLRLLPLFLLVCLTHFTPTRLEPRLGLLEARHPPVCSDAERGINVLGDRPEPAQLWERVAVLINTADRLAVLNDAVVRALSERGEARPVARKARAMDAG